jgi:uncharacterized cupredoxin-like copper-binding protein
VSDQFTEDREAARAMAYQNGAPAPTLATVLDEVREQSARTRRVQQGFAFFAVLAFVIALVNLVVIAAKLNDTKTVTVTTAAPAAAATGAGTAAGAAGSTGSAAGATTALQHKVGIKLAEFSVTPNAPTAAAGKVTFNVQNAGQVQHEFVVLRTDKKAGDLLNKSGEADEGGNVGEIGNINPGSAKQLTLKLPAGHYALICNLPGHYKAGQYADFTVK